MDSKQLILFKETREEKLEHRLILLENQMDKVRKNLFAKYAELMQMCMEQKEYIDRFRNQSKEFQESST